MAQLLPAARAMVSSATDRLHKASPVNLAAAVFFATFAGQALRNLLGWPGYAVVVLTLFAATIVALGQRAAGTRLSFLPTPLLLFLALGITSVTWSKYADATLLGLIVQLATTAAGVLIAVTCDWQKALDALWLALKWILGLSLVFEFIVAVFIQKPFMPLWMPPGHYPDTFAWSTGDLFSFGPIQGIVANRNLLAFVALLAVIVLAIRFFERPAARRNTMIWFAVTGVVMLLTRSATVTIALFAIVALAGVVQLMRHLPNHLRRYLYPGGALVLLTAIATLVVNQGSLFSFVGRDQDMTGRLEIWSKVSLLAEHQPMFGWGWVGYWAPWVKPFKDLVVIDGTTYLQAHNALLDIWLQLGVAGVVVALCVAITAGARSWRIAVSPISSTGLRRPFQAINMLPLLLLAALLIQSLTESRLLIEGNWLLFVFICCAVKADAPPRGSSKLFGTTNQPLYDRNGRLVRQ